MMSFKNAHLRSYWRWYCKIDDSGLLVMGIADPGKGGGNGHCDDEIG